MRERQTERQREPMLKVCTCVRVWACALVRVLYGCDCVWACVCVYFWVRDFMFVIVFKLLFLCVYVRACVFVYVCFMDMLCMGVCFPVSFVCVRDVICMFLCVLVCVCVSVHACVRLCLCVFTDASSVYWRVRVFVGVGVYGCVVYGYVLSCKLCLCACVRACSRMCVHLSASAGGRGKSSFYSLAWIHAYFFVHSADQIRCSVKYQQRLVCTFEPGC